MAQSIASGLVGGSGGGGLTGSAVFGNTTSWCGWSRGSCGLLGSLGRGARGAGIGVTLGVALISGARGSAALGAASAVAVALGIALTVAVALGIALAVAVTLGIALTVAVTLCTGVAAPALSVVLPSITSTAASIAVSPTPMQLSTRIQLAGHRRAAFTGAAGFVTGRSSAGVTAAGGTIALGSVALSIPSAPAAAPSFAQGLGALGASSIESASASAWAPGGGGVVLSIIPASTSFWTAFRRRSLMRSGALSSKIFRTSGL
jgi:hypothetical protein